MRSFRTATLATTAIVSGLVAIKPAQAQEPASAEPIVLERVVVSARKRDEAADDVPVSLTVRSFDERLQASPDPAAEIARSTPNFNFVDFAVPGQAFATMRGIAPLGSPLNSLDNTVGFSVDGVPSSSFGFAPTLLDVERVEVLRGPQGTLFGRNALGGSVNVINRPADGQREFRLSGEYGTDNHAFIEGIAGGWIVPDQLAGRGVLRFQKVDGDIPNPILGIEEGDVRIQAGRGTLTFTPDDTLTVSLSGGFDFDKRMNPLYLWREHPDYPVSGVDTEQYGTRRTGYGNITVTKDFDAFSLTSITGLQQIRLHQINDPTDAFVYGEAFKDFGYLPGDFNDPTTDWADAREKERILTQEVRLNSAEGEPVAWVAGLSYFRSDYGADRAQASQFFSANNGTYDTDIDSQTWAAFGDVSVALTDRLTVSGGARIAHDRQELDALYVSNGFPGNVASYAQSQTYEDTYATGRAALSWKWTDDVQTYASVARGYASGGFERYTLNAEFGVPAEPFRPSKVWTYEIGTKASLLDGRLEVAGAVFYNDVTDGQLTSFDPLLSTYGFANQDYRSYGAELEAKFDMDGRWWISGGIGLTRSEMTNVDLADATGAVDGNGVPNVPQVTANLGLGYRHPIEAFGMDGALTAEASYQFVGARDADISNSFKLDSYNIVNVSLGVELDNRRLYVFGRNLLDERPEYFGSTFSPTAHAVIVGRGRTIGVGASVSW